MNCLSLRAKTGLLVMVAVLIVGGLMPVVARAAEKDLFDPFALDAMIIAAESGSSTVAVTAPADGQPTELRTQQLHIPVRPALRSPFRPGHPDLW